MVNRTIQTKTIVTISVRSFISSSVKIFLSLSRTLKVPYFLIPKTSFTCQHKKKLLKIAKAIFREINSYETFEILDPLQNIYISIYILYKFVS